MIYSSLRPISIALILTLVLTGTTRAAGPVEIEPAAPSVDNVEMTVGQAVVLGVVEGATEYLPISSTGHLILAQRAMGIGAGPADKTSPQVDEDARNAANAFAICIQAGAILAVVGLYWPRCWQMVLGLFGRSPQGRKLMINLIVAVLPAVVLGLSFEKIIKGTLFGLWPIVIAWLVGGIAIIAVGRWRRSKRGSDEAHGEGEHAGIGIDELTWKQALGVGLLQCIAMWPGTSRSLMTIVGGVVVGLRLTAAVEFSFLLGVVTLGGATLKDSVEFGPLMLDVYGPIPIIAGSFAAFISALIAIKWMVAYLNKHPLDVFGYYRIAIAIAVAVLLWQGILVTA